MPSSLQRPSDHAPVFDQKHLHYDTSPRAVLAVADEGTIRKKTGRQWTRGKARAKRATTKPLGASASRLPCAGGWPCGAAALRLRDERRDAGMPTRDDEAAERGLLKVVVEERGRDLFHEV